MAAAVRINKSVVLKSSDNKCLQYPVAGVLEDAEFAVDGSIIWATFRRDGVECPVVVKRIVEA